MAKKLLKKAFTLVELIIVIAIVAILAVISFLWLNKWLGNARDASRKGNLANLDKALQIYLTERTTLPKPDNNTMLYASGIDYIIGYQGYFGETARDTIGNIDKAPKDGNNYFTYYVNNDLKKYQLMAYMENPVAYNPNTANAENFSKRYIYVRGDKLGILTDSDKNPLQDFGGTGFNILSGKNIYIAYLDNTTNASGTGKQLFTYYYNQTKSLLQNTGFAQYDDNLVGYWDMETMITSEGKIAFEDVSKENNTGYCYSGTSEIDCGSTPVMIKDGNSGKFALLDGIRGLIVVNHSDSLNLGATGEEITYSLSLKIEGPKKLSTLFGKLSGSQIEYSYPFYLYQNYYTDATPALRTYVKSRNVIAKGASNTNLDLNDGYRNNITVVLNPSKGSLKMYKNGNLIANTISDFSQNFQNTDPLYIGCRDKLSICTKGSIDEVRIYNRALSDDEVKALYTATN